MTALRKPDDTRLLVTTGDESHETTWGEFRKDNRDDVETIKAAWLVVLGVKDRVTLGGGAGPEYKVERAKVTP